MRVVRRVLYWLATIITAFVALLIVAGYVAYRRYVLPDANQLVVGESPGTVPMRWVAASTNPDEPHGALLVPVRVGRVDRTFYLQLDLGHPSTELYRPMLEAIERHSGPGAVDSDGDLRSVADLRVRIGDVPVQIRRVRLRNLGDGSIRWGDPEGVELIGTLGSDFLEGRSLLVDYRREQLLVNPKREGLVPESIIADFDFRYRRVLLPARIGGRRVRLLYDSGSSAYALVTDKETWQRLALPGSATTIGSANSWGRTVATYTRPTTAAAVVGATEVPLGEVTYLEGIGVLSELAIRATGLGGLTGNKLFEGGALWLDAANEKFAVLR